MKKLLAISLSLALGMAAYADSGWRTFSSSDGERTFEGRLTAYNSDTRIVTVENRRGQAIHFKEDVISERDREYVREMRDSLPPVIRLDVGFDRVQERTDFNNSGGTRTSKYNCGYKITLRNHTSMPYSNVEIDYLLIYHKDVVNGKGTDHVVSGSKSIELGAKRTVEIDTQTVALTSFYKSGAANTSTSSSSGGGGCRGGSCGSGSRSSSSTTTYSRAERSRDSLVGCVVQVKVNGYIVTTTATSPKVLAQYQGEIGGSSAYR